MHKETARAAAFAARRCGDLVTAERLYNELLRAAPSDNVATISRILSRRLLQPVTARHRKAKLVNNAGFVSRDNLRAVLYI